MPDLTAYREREAYDHANDREGILRDEWRVLPSEGADSKTFERIRVAAGPYHRGGIAYYLEHRYIRFGRPEPWGIVDASDYPDQLMSQIDEGAVALDPILKLLQRERRIKRGREIAAKFMDDRERERKEAAERRKELSNGTFLRMLEGDNERNRALALLYQETVKRIQGRGATILREMRNNGPLMAAYLSVLEATTIPAKAKAIRVFVERAEKFEAAFLVGSKA